MLPYSKLGCKFNVVRADNSGIHLNGMFSADEPSLKFSDGLFSNSRGIIGHVESVIVPTDHCEGYGPVSGTAIEFKKLYVSSLGDQKVFRLAFDVFNTENDNLLYQLQTDICKLLSKPAKITSTKQDCIYCWFSVYTQRF